MSARGEENGFLRCVVLEATRGEIIIAVPGVHRDSKVPACCMRTSKDVHVASLILLCITRYQASPSSHGGGAMLRDMIPGSPGNCKACTSYMWYKGPPIHEGNCKIAIVANRNAVCRHIPALA